MNADTPTLEQSAAYQQAFDYFNRELFNGELPQVILNFSRSGSRTIAFYAPKRWQPDDLAAGQVIDEISLNPRYLGRTLDAIMSSLVHEMCHLWQFEFGKPSRRAYHNKEWATKMKSVGLQPDDGTGKETGQKVSHQIIGGGPFQVAFEAMPAEFSLPWRVFVEANAMEEPGKDAPNKPKRKAGVKFKYTCPQCETNLWGKDGLRVICADCDTEFQQV